MSQTVILSRGATQDLVAFLGKLPIDSGAAIYYGALRAALDTPAPVSATATAPIKGKSAPKAKTKAKAAPIAGLPAATDAQKDEIKRQKAAENARKWRARKALEKSAAQAQAGEAQAAPSIPQHPVLFT